MSWVCLSNSSTSWQFYDFTSTVGSSDRHTWKPQYIYGDHHDMRADIHLLSEILSCRKDIFTRPIDRDHAWVRRLRLLYFWSCPWKRQFHKYQVDQASLIPAHSIDLFDLWSVPVVCIEATHEDTLRHETHWIAQMSQSESRITSSSRSYHQILSIPCQRHKCLWWIVLEWAFPET